MFRVSKNSIVFVIILMLTSCLSSERFASLEKRGVPEWQQTKPDTQTSQPSKYRPDYYLVKPGDTLYSIAFRFGLDYKKLANANAIGSDFRIFEGQSIRLSEKSVAPKPTSSPAKPQETSKTSVAGKTVTNTSSQKNDAPVVPSLNDKHMVRSWVWPHNGKIVRTFRSGVSDRKGIDISGRIGDSVLAAAGGTVVYAGDGLPGYGNLIIVEHSNSYLSAYAFTDRILVNEKESVDAGQKIATMGKQGDQPGLHFEIRQDGKPVNPLQYLPRR